MNLRKILIDPWIEENKSMRPNVNLRDWTISENLDIVRILPVILERCRLYETKSSASYQTFRLARSILTHQSKSSEERKVASKGKA